MGLAVSSVRVPEKLASSGGLSPEQLTEIYRLMVLSRRVDDREILLKTAAEGVFPGFGRRSRGAAGGRCAGVAAGV